MLAFICCSCPGLPRPLNLPHPPPPDHFACILSVRSALFPQNHITSGLYLNVTFLMGPPTSATPSVSDTSIPHPRASWLLFPGPWATNSAPVATVTPHPVRGSHQCHMDTTQQHHPSGPHHIPLALRFRASLPGQGSRCHRTCSLPTSMQAQIAEV